MSIRTGYFAKATAVLIPSSCFAKPLRRTRWWEKGRIKRAILRNEPILFSHSFRCIDFRYRILCRLQRRLQMGSFSKNEPIWKGVFDGFGCRRSRKGTQNPRDLKEQYGDLRSDEVRGRETGAQRTERSEEHTSEL